MAKEGKKTGALFTVRMSDELLAELDERIARRSPPPARSDVVRLALKEWIERDAAQDPSLPAASAS